MNKTVKRCLIIIAIVVVLFAIIWLVYDMVKSKPASAQVDTNLVDENTGLDNVINELFDNVIENEISENVVENNTQNHDEQTQNKQVNSSTSVTESHTSKEERAVELVKKEWGSSSGVYFSNDSVDEQGRYIVSVHDSKTTMTLAFYLVDLDKGTVTEQ